MRVSPLSRRGFLRLSGSALAVSSCGRGGEGREAKRPGEGTPGARQTGSPEDLEHAAIDAALDAAKRGGASYADIRVVHRLGEAISTREDHVTGVSSSASYGLGVRVLVDGAWGFAAAADVAPGPARAAAAEAITIARAARGGLKRRVELAAAPVVRGTWRTPMQIDPFEVPLADKAQYLLDLWPLVRDVKYVKYATGSYEALREHKTFASSEGTLVTQTIVRVAPTLSVTVVDGGEFESRNSEVAPMQAGWEYVAASRLRADARRYAEDAAEKLKAPSVTPGKKDLVLAPSNLWLTIHESVGHPTELDRAVGLEANLAGTSFATPDKLGKLRYGSPIVTIYADKTTPGGLATCAWDDDGVPTGRWNLVDKGVFAGYQTTREQAAWIGERASRGTSYAEDHKAVAFQRMPNVSLAPGEPDLSLDDIVGVTEEGILVSGNGSWSIDHQRYNFQFSGQTFHEIKHGRIVGPLRDVAYQSNSIEFWNSCDLVGGASAWRMFGTLWDGKGQPGQANAVSHGCPPARFRGVNVLDVNRRKR
jgi:TldD protein